MKSSKPAFKRKAIPAFRRAKGQPAKSGGSKANGARKSGAGDPLEATIDRDRIVLEAKKEVVLRCGKASLTLTADGKIVIKGANLLTTSSGAHRIRGASVSIN